MASIWELMVSISGDNSNFKRSLKDSSDELNKFSALTSSIGEQVAKAAERMFEAFTVAEFIKGISEAAEAVEKANIQIQRSTGATGAVLESLKGSFEEVYGHVSQSAAQVGSALSTLYQRTGLTGEGLINLTTSSAEFAKVAGVDMASSVSENERLFKQWGVAADEQAGKLDELLVASQKSGVSTQQLSQQLAAASPTLRQYGYSFDQALTLVASFAKAGLDASEVVGGLNRAFANWAKELKDPQTELAALIDQIRFAATTGDAVRIALANGFTARNVTPFVDAVRQGALDMHAMEVSIGNAAGKVHELATETKTLSDNWAEFTHRVGTGVQPLWEGLKETLSYDLGLLNQFLDGLGKTLDYNDKLVASAARGLGLTTGSINTSAAAVRGVPGLPANYDQLTNQGGHAQSVVSGGPADSFGRLPLDQSQLNTLQNLINADRINAAAGAFESLASAIARSGLSIQEYLTKGISDLDKLTDEAPKQTNNLLVEYASTADDISKQFNKSMQDMAESTVSVDNVMRALGTDSQRSLQKAYDEARGLQAQIVALYQSGLAGQQDLQRAAQAVHDAFAKVHPELQKTGNDGQQAIKRISDTIGKDLTRTIADLITHTRKVGDVFKQLGRSVIETLLQPVEAAFAKMLTSWITHLLAGKAATSTVNSAEVTGQAGITGAAAFASVMAALPFPANVAAAPGVAAAEVAQVLGTFLPMAAFEKGGNVPYDMPAFLHAKEMVLPADIAVPLRANIASNRISGGGAGNPVTFQNCSFGDNSMGQVVRKLRLAGVRI